jgi:replicative DNA helicase
MKEFDENVFYNLAAEVDVIGGLLFDNNSINAVSESVKKSHFYNPIHGEIFEAIERLINRRRVADPMTVANNLAGNKEFIEAGGIEYLYKIASKYAESSFAINLPERGRLIKSLHIERKFLDVLE